MDATQSRTVNIRHFVAKAGGPTAFANQYGNGRWSQDQVSQWISEKNPKSIGKRLARDLEAELGIGHGDLDRVITAEAHPDRSINGRAEVTAAPSPLPPMSFVDRVSGAHLAAGSGEIVWDFDLVERSHSFRTDWMQAKGLRPERCKVWSVRGDSMEPRYLSGDVVLIDMSDRKPVHGKVFGLIGDDGLRIKQLRRTATGWEMYSFNPDQSRFPPEPILQDSDGRESHAIIGRVRWRGGEED